MKIKRILVRLFLAGVAALLLSILILKVGREKGLISMQGWPFKLGTTTATGFLALVFWKLFDVIGGNVLWDAFKAFWAGCAGNASKVMTTTHRSESKILDRYNIEKVHFNALRLHTESYIAALKFANKGSDRIKAEESLRELHVGKGALIGLYAATSCGRQALVFGNLKEELCPLFVVKANGMDLLAIRQRIVGYINDSVAFKDGSFFIKVTKQLSSDEARTLIQTLYRTVSEGKENGKTLRIIVSFNCLENLQMYNIVSLFHLTTLFTNESERFLSEVAGRYAAEQRPNLMTELSRSYRGGRLGRFVHAYSQGNPVGIIRFVKVFVSQSNRLDSPLVVMERGWRKRTQHLGLSDQDRLVAHAILHFILTMSANKDLRSVDLGPIMDAVSGGTCDANRFANVQSYVSEILLLPEHVSLRPFDLRRVDYCDFRYDHYVLSCGENDDQPYTDAWQTMFMCVLSCPAMKEYRAAFCDGVISAAIRAALTNALPYQQSPRMAYTIVDTVFPRALAFAFADEFVKKEVSRFVQTARNQAWQRVSNGVIEYLARRFDNMMPDEIRNVVKEDLETCCTDDDYFWRLGDLLPFMLAGCPDPVGWVINIDDLSDRADRLFKSSRNTSIDVLFAFACLLEMTLLDAQGLIAFNGVIFQKWVDFAHSLRMRASDSITALMKQLSIILADCELLCKEGETALRIADRLREALQIVRRKDGYDDAPCAMLGLASVIGFSCRLMIRGNDGMAEMLLDDVRDTLDKSPLFLLSVRKWLLPRALHALSMNQSLRLPSACTVESLKGFYLRSREKMDDISARYGFDGENRPWFLVRLALAVDEMLSRYRDQKEFEDVLQKELHDILQDIMEVKDAVNYQDLMQILILMGRHLSSCNKTERDWFIELWDEVEQKIPRMSAEIGWMSLLEASAFAQCAGSVMNDQCFSKTRFTTVFLEKIANSAALGLMTDAARLIWAESLFPPFASYDFANISLRLARIALGEDRLMPSCPSSDGKIAPETLIRYFVDNRNKVPVDILKRTDGVFDCMIRSVAQYVSSAAFKNGDQYLKLDFVSKLKWTIDNYGLPAARAAAAGTDSYRQQDVLNLNSLLLCLVGGDLNADIIPGLEADVGEITAFLESDCCVDMINSAFGDAKSPSERVNSILTSVEARSPVDQLSSIASFALTGSSITELLGLESGNSEVARKIYQIASQAYATLSTEALKNVGYVAYDNIVENLFAQDANFIASNSDLIPEMIRYVQNELAKRRKPQVVKRLLKILNAKYRESHGR